MNIGQFSKKYKVSLDTLRFYEKINLLTPHRKPSGYRDYQCVHEEQIKFILCLKEIGFSLREIQEVLTLAAKPANQKCKDLSNKILQNKVKELNDSIQFYTYARDQLCIISEFIQINSPIENQQYIQNIINQLYLLKV
ncbi:MerR family transcriptional regulator [Acinetobacter nectaris]|uniref:MerR family transcriptional regulator n=1 Tax=Acinetobacter nectaris TaxID=1219382 RepID=UPI001F431BD7|nr:MerR family transcriptional regulator [Acinetobacter nectaris]MCF9035230.1 MerR family transcriptional regulator [Acinetobacter nectaris]